MAYLGISSHSGRLICRDDPATDVRLHIAQAIQRLPAQAPVVIMIHGFRYAPEAPFSDPHLTLYSSAANQIGRCLASWTDGMGFSDTGFDDGLAVGFGWEAAAHSPSWHPMNMRGFPRIYKNAAVAGERLARVCHWINELAPDRTIDLMAHSLGARVALRAVHLHSTNIGRVILMGAAEYASEADQVMKRLPHPSPLEVFNIRARENVFYDFLFEALAPRKKRGDIAIGRGYDGPHHRWLNVATDDASTLQALSVRGVGLGRSQARITHSGFYTRPGMFGFYQSLIRDREKWSLRDLRRDIEARHASPPILLPATPVTG